MNRIILSVLITLIIGLAAGTLLVNRGSVNAQGPPNKPLSSVAHDSTLIGDGTTASPLGVAPFPGGAGPLRVVDSLGNEAGVYDGGFTVRRDENLNTWIAFLVGRDGFVQSGNFSYTTFDCTGTAYVGGSTFSQLVDLSFVVGDTVYQPTGSPQMITSNSSRNLGGPCEVSTFTQLRRPTTTYPVSDFGLTPPFTLTR